MVGRLARLSLGSVALTIAVSAPAGAAKVNANPLTHTADEATSYVVSFTLDQPIIAATPNPTVVVTLTPPDPSRISLSATSLQWAASEWFQPRSVTVTVLADGVHNDINDFTVDASTSSESVYYDGFVTSFAVSIVDNDPAPTTTTSSTAPPASTPTTAVPAEPVTVATSTPTAVETTTAAAADDTGGIARTGASLPQELTLGAAFVVAGALMIHTGRSRRAARV